MSRCWISLVGLLVGCAATTATTPAPTTATATDSDSDSATDSDSDSATDSAPATATAPHCPPDPEAADQLALAAPAEQWPAEVRLRIRVRADGAIDCVRLVSTTHDGFVEDCKRMLGERHAPRRGEDGAPVDAWLTFLCQFEPKH